MARATLRKQTHYTHKSTPLPTVTTLAAWAKTSRRRCRAPAWWMLTWCWRRLPRAATTSSPASLGRTRSGVHVLCVWGGEPTGANGSQQRQLHTVTHKTHADATPHIQTPRSGPNAVLARMNSTVDSAIDAVNALLDKASREQVCARRKSTLHGAAPDQIE